VIDGVHRDASTAHLAALKQDVQSLREQVDAERAIKTEAFDQLTRHVTDPVYKADNAAKEIILTRDCSNVQGECQGKEVINPDEHVFVHGPDGQIYVFNHGINNTEDEAMANAIKQHGQTAHEAGIYTVINPHTGNIVTEVVYATLDKLREVSGWNWLLGASNASLARNDLVMAVARHNQEAMQNGGPLLRIEEANHSRGSLTASHATQILIYEGNSDVPIASVLFNGAAANADRMADRIEQVTGGQGEVWQSTHQNDFVGKLIGGNPVTGGQAAGFGDAHSHYGPGVDLLDRIDIWGGEQGSIAIPVIPATRKEIE